MLSSMKLPMASASKPLVLRQPARQTAVKISCAATTWDSWTGYITKHRGDSAGAKKTREESSYSTELAAAISSSAASFKPKFSTPTETHQCSDFKLSRVEQINGSDLPKDLHEKLEAIGVLQLKAALGVDKAEAGNISFTTTDVDAAVSVSGVILQQGLDKTAVVSLVATETQREASWSRLEGLILHWACSDSAGGAWALPPQGWKSSPDNAVDAGGAWQCTFEKQMIGGGARNEFYYVLLLQLPLKGVLKSGGITFVLKATAGQNTRWLKDDSTQKDFFLDLTRLPVMKA